MGEGTDLEYARMVSKFIRSNHKEVLFTPDEGLDTIDKVVYAVETWDTTTVRASVGQFIVSKHRNGGLENIRIRFIPSLGKFEDLDNFESPYEFHSKMNAAANDDTFKGNEQNEEDLPF